MKACSYPFSIASATLHCIRSVSQLMSSPLMTTAGLRSPRASWVREMQTSTRSAAESIKLTNGQSREKVCREEQAKSMRGCRMKRRRNKERRQVAADLAASLRFAPSDLVRY